MSLYRRTGTAIQTVEDHHPLVRFLPDDEVPMALVQDRLHAVSLNRRERPNHQLRLLSSLAGCPLRVLKRLGVGWPAVGAADPAGHKVDDIGGQPPSSLDDLVMA